MGNQIPISTTVDLPDGRQIILETGKIAAQAHGSCILKMGKTMLFASVVSSTEIREGFSYFPLSVDYQERFASTGRIPGNFFRREAKLSDYEVLVSRLIDRAIRPLFPDGYMFDTQVMVNLISSEEGVLPDALAALAVSTALSVSDIPFNGPLSEVRVALIDGQYVVNPNKDVLANAELDVIVAATLDNVMMVEGDANECSEAQLIEAIKVGHDAIKVQCQAQLDLAEKVGEKATVKREFIPEEIDEELMNSVKNQIVEPVTGIATAALDKLDRKKQLKEIKENLILSLTEEKGEEYVEENSKTIGEYFDKVKKETIREVVMSQKIRLDGRKSDEIRPIWSEVDYLPSTHGSAVFTRGETQSLTSLTLGTKQDEQLIDTALEHYTENFILHYNFPAYSVGETRPNRGPGRREVGHANLAGRSIKKVMPADYPYTVRLVSDIMESNGSSSMATVCASSLALMDGGVPISAPVSGIAMGLISDGERAVVLSDILGDEDALGDMDFKVTGTRKGITACQMDIKIDGLPYDLMVSALEQARQGRLHILDRMGETLAEPREDLKPHAPRIVELVIDKSFIGAVIGPGGKIIQEIQKETGTIINIEEEGETGIVNIASNDKDSLDKATAWVKRIVFVPEVGDVMDAKVAAVMPYGVFVDFAGKSGLLHISEISHTRIENVEDVFKVGDPVKVKLINIDPRTGKFRLSRKALLEKPQRDSDQNKD
jgi:polyribonucleotide nucleotidyltransferase